MSLSQERNPTSIRSEAGRVIRLHDYVENGDPMPRSLLRASRQDELLNDLVDAADRFLNAGRETRRAAEEDLLKTTDRIKRRLGRVNDWKR